MMKPSNLLLFTDQTDIMQAIESVLQDGSFQLHSFRSPADLLSGNVGEAATKNRPGEPTEGEDASIFATIVELQSALIFVDLDNLALNWKKWMPILKSSPATRRTPIVAWAGEMSADVKTVARSRGAEIAIGRDIFLRDVAKIIAKKALTVDHEAIAAACAEPLSELALKGLELFNKGEYFECHEELEHAWNADQGAARELYRGVLQVAVAYLQIERGNYNGAVKMLMRVKQWLDPLPKTCRGIDVETLRNDANDVYKRLQELGRDRLAEFDRGSFRPVKYDA